MINLTKGRAALVGLALVLAALALGACSDDDGDELGGSDETVPAEISATGEAAEWCQEVINVDQQRLSEGLAISGSADVAAFSQAVTSLAATAPDDILPSVQTLATLSTTLVQSDDPDATLPPAAEAEFTEAATEVQTWVRDNCGGYELQI